MSISREESDPVATVVDWLDACRSGSVHVLLDLYDEAATIECACHGTQSLTGRAALEAYWRPKLAHPSPGSFAMDDVSAETDGVTLDYQSFEGRPVRIHFRFSDTGKILYTRCAPLGRCAA
ncbi:nuclear transport factor 2 family protein [uncultured Bradyrhizobium sp.]|uniref:nuclear transport factor 2 family protein n=1 Tax=uncultured Bradyrhizobium sp. TaxID=199684 RepID=UPI0035CA1BFB